MRHALRPGGRVSAVVYSTPDRNEFFSIPVRIIRERAQLPPPLPGQPGPFSLGGPGVLEAAFTQAGFTDVEIRTVPSPVRLPSAAECVRFERESFGALHQMMRTLSAEEQADTWATIEAELTAVRGRVRLRGSLRDARRGRHPLTVSPAPAGAGARAGRGGRDRASRRRRARRPRSQRTASCSTGSGSPSRSDAVATRSTRTAEIGVLGRQPLRDRDLAAELLATPGPGRPASARLDLPRRAPRAGGRAGVRRPRRPAAHDAAPTTGVAGA